MRGGGGGGSDVSCGGGRGCGVLASTSIVIIISLGGVNCFSGRCRCRRRCRVRSRLCSSSTAAPTTALKSILSHPPNLFTVFSASHTGHPFDRTTNGSRTRRTETGTLLLPLVARWFS